MTATHPHALAGPMETAARRPSCEPRPKALARAFWPHATLARVLFAVALVFILASLASLAFGAPPEDFTTAARQPAPPPPAWTITDHGAIRTATHEHDQAGHDRAACAACNEGPRRPDGRPLRTGTRRAGQAIGTAGRRAGQAIGTAGRAIRQGLARLRPFRRCS